MVSWLEALLLGAVVWLLLATSNPGNSIGDALLRYAPIGLVAGLLYRWLMPAVLRRWFGKNQGGPPKSPPSKRKNKP